MANDKKTTELQIVEETQKPQIVAEIRIAPYKYSTSDFLEDYYNCVLCGSELLYTHVTNFVDLNVCEEAECSACHIKMKKETHGLQ